MDISDLFNPGLYKITCLKNNKIYIGQSSNVLSRLGRHSDNLENNRHDCLELQKDFNRFGKIFFKFESLEIGEKYVNENLRKKREQEYIKGNENIYNFKLNHNWNFYSQKLKIFGKTYNSLRQAALSLKESRTQISRKCRDETNIDYVFLEQTNYDKIYKKNSIPCKIDNKIYYSISQASKSLKQSFTTIKKRCKSKKYPNYIFLNDEKNKIYGSNDYPEGE